jgi:hypothetical protein
VYSPVYFRARITHHNLVIFGVGFSKLHTIQVGVSERKPVYWVLLGTAQAKRSGRLEATFHLPNNLWSERMLWVCVRDTTTGKTACSVAYHY